MSIIIDVAICALIVLIAVRSYKKGFAAALLGLCGSLISVFAAFKLSPLLSSTAYNVLFKNRIITAVSDRLGEGFSNVAEAIDKTVPSFIYRAAQSLGVDISATTQLGETASLAESIEASIISPVVLLILRIVAIILLFAVFSFLVKLLSKLFKGLNSLPLLGSLNKLLGFLLGIISGCLFAAVICSLVSAITGLFGGKLLFITSAELAETNVFSFFSGLLSLFDPVSLIK